MRKNAASFPETLQEAIIYFANYENCHRLMVDLRWPDGNVKCPRCGSEHVAYLEKARVWKCYEKHASPKFSLKVGTIFEDSPISLDKWLTAFWLIMNCKNGISSCEIARDLKITQKSAWFMDHRIRLAIHQGGFDAKMGGPGSEVEADETFIGGLSRNMLESSNETVSYIHNFLERFKQRFTLDNPLFAERYAKGEKHALIFFEIKGFSEKFLAHLQVRRWIQERKYSNSGFSTVGVTNSNGWNALSDCQQGAVLISDIQSMEHPESVCPSLIRLGSVDSINRRLKHALYLSHLSVPVFFGAVKDGKLDMSERVFFGGDSDSICILPDELKSHVVQCSADIVEHIPGNQGEFGWDYRKFLDIVNAFMSIQITFSTKFIIIGKPSNNAVKVTEVCFGPINFCV